MAKVKLIMSYAQIKKMVAFYEKFSDDKVKSCTLIGKPKGIKATFEVETDLAPDEAAAYLKKAFTSAPGNAMAYCSVQPEGFFG